MTEIPLSALIVSMNTLLNSLDIDDPDRKIFQFGPRLRRRSSEAILQAIHRLDLKIDIKERT